MTTKEILKRLMNGGVSVEDLTEEQIKALGIYWRIEE
jgi:hypothetical protein